MYTVYCFHVFSLSPGHILRPIWGPFPSIFLSEEILNILVDISRCCRLEVEARVVFPSSWHPSRCCRRSDLSRGPVKCNICIAFYCPAPVVHTSHSFYQFFDFGQVWKCVCGGCVCVWGDLRRASHLRY